MNKRTNKRTNQSSTISQQSTYLSLAHLPHTLISLTHSSPSHTLSQLLSDRVDCRDTRRPSFLSSIFASPCTSSPCTSSPSHSILTKDSQGKKKARWPLLPNQSRCHSTHSSQPERLLVLPSFCVFTLSMSSRRECSCREEQRSAQNVTMVWLMPLERLSSLKGK